MKLFFLNARTTNTLLIILCIVTLVFTFLFCSILLCQNAKLRNLKTTSSEEITTNNSFGNKDFIANISHDIRTPLNAIIGLSSMALSHADDSEKVIDDLNKINSSSHHLLELINSVLDLSKIQSGKVTLEHEALDIKKHLDDALVMFEGKIKEKNMQLKVNTNLQNNYYFGDELRIKQIFINLMSNAYKYTSAGGSIFIDLTEEEKDANSSNIRFTIKDTGQGMTKEFIKQVFEPYSRSGLNDKSVEGTGLGTCIVRDLVKLMNGTIEVDSEVGKGSTFDVLLDLDKCIDEELIKELESKNKKAKPQEVKLKQFPGKKMLIVDDSPINRMITASVALKMGVQVDEAENGLESITALKSKEPYYYDVIVMDVRMPEMNGYEATKEIRSMRKDLKTIPILAMTADAFKEDIDKAYKAGMNDHMAKPLEFNKIYQTFEKWLEKGNRG